MAQTTNESKPHAHVGVGYCNVCGHYGSDCTGKITRQTGQEDGAEGNSPYRIRNRVPIDWAVSFDLDSDGLSTEDINLSPTPPLPDCAAVHELALLLTVIADRGMEVMLQRLRETAERR